MLALFSTVGHVCLMGEDKAAITEGTLCNGTIHPDGMCEVLRVIGSDVQVVEVGDERLVGKQLLVVSQFMQTIGRGDKAHTRLEVTVEVVFAVLGRVDVEAVRDKNPRVHHIVGVFRWTFRLMCVEPYLELQGELVVDFCL